MDAIRLDVPFTVPLLGEAFVEAGTPLLTAALGFSWRVTVKKSESPKLSIPISSPYLKKILSKFLASQGLDGYYSVSGPHEGGSDQDFVNAAALLYLTECGAIEESLPQLLKRAGSWDFVTAARALTSLSGGVVASRQGEGFLSIDSTTSGPICLRILPGRRIDETPVSKFSKEFPALSDSMWHLVAHLVLEGIGAIQRGDLAALGRAFSLEASLLYATGQIALSDLQRISGIPSLGSKVIVSPALVADLAIPSEGVLPDDFQMVRFSYEGVNEIEG
uniref:Uncharacterized protein n=1 Tax=Candidatus Methanosuratincola petrocarbonis (ex Vanwonterghem et al. 2016) TaxID=1867261 RepID=A0A7J3UXJ4_9CREN